MSTPARDFFEQPRNKAVHNLLFERELPVGTKTLFGNGLNFCLRGRTPTNKLQDTIDRFENDVRRTNYWLKNPKPPDQQKKYNPKMYFRSETTFGPNDDDVEECLAGFSQDLWRAQKRWRGRHPPNLTPRMFHLLNQFKKCDTYIVIEADKNLGVCILEREYYIKRAIEEHLGNSSVYKIISKTDANTIQYKLSFKFSEWLGRHASTVPEHERDYLRTARDCYTKLARLRMSWKLHKTPN